jgi:hypothetical protein
VNILLLIFPSKTYRDREEERWCHHWNGTFLPKALGRVGAKT